MTITRRKYNSSDDEYLVSGNIKTIRSEFRPEAGRQAGSKAGRQAGRDRTSLSCPCHNVKYRVRVLSLSLLGNGFCSSYTGSDHSNRKYNRRLYSDVNAKRLI